MNKSIGLNNNRVLSSNYTSSKSHHSLFHLLSQSQRPWDFWDVSLLFLLVFGLVGNLLSIIVMSRKRMRNTNASLFVTSMAISDCLFLSIKFLSNVIKMHRLPIYSSCIVIQNVLPHTTLFVSVWLIIITSLERAIAVLYPFRVAILFSHTRCKCLIAAICIFFFALSNSTTPCLEYNLEKPYYCQIKGFQNGTCFFYYSYVFPWIKAALGAWIPSVLGILLNVLIARGLFAASRARQSIVSESVPLRQMRSSITTNSLQISHSAQKLACPNNVLKTNYSSADVVNLINSSRRASSQNMSPQNNQYQVQQQQQGGQQSSHLNHHKEKQITIMLMTISISFMVLSFPYSAFELLRRLNVNLPILKDRDTSRFLLLLLDINHATNFILYCLTGQKFRSELKALLMQWLRPGRYQDEYKQQISQMSSVNGNIQIRRVNDDKTQTFN